MSVLARRRALADARNPLLPGRPVSPGEEVCPALDCCQTLLKGTAGEIQRGLGLAEGPATATADAATAADAAAGASTAAALPLARRLSECSGSLCPLSPSAGVDEKSELDTAGSSLAPKSTKRRTRSEKKKDKRDQYRERRPVRRAHERKRRRMKQQDARHTLLESMTIEERRAFIHRERAQAVDDAKKQKEHLEHAYAFGLKICINCSFDEAMNQKVRTQLPPMHSLA
eukprot:GHVT01012107.1.p1 GENE.GHVT01012107.1~~GHVT01012107.1.p1  ORF type:complete len:229 (-),score=43.46 GHVT01012107.1:185-871(-)